MFAVEAIALPIVKILDFQREGLAIDSGTFAVFVDQTVAKYCRTISTMR